MMRSDSITHTGWIAKNKRIKFSFGGFLLYSLRVRALVLDGISADLPNNPIDTPLPLDTAPPEFRAALVVSHPIREKLPRVAFTRGLLRYVPHQYRRFYLDMNGSFDAYLSRFSSHRRSHLQRGVKRFLQSGGSFREYSKPEEMAEYYRYAREVSAKTYQEHLIDAGLPATREFFDDLVERAQRDAIRGYLLFHNGAPVAYEYCPAERDLLFYERVGFDPEARQWGPGTVLLFLVIEHLFAEHRFRRFDFGAGEFEYKEMFGTGYIACADIYFFRRNPRNVGLVAAHATLNVCWRGVAAVLNGAGILQKLKRTVRSRCV